MFLFLNKSFYHIKYDEYLKIILIYYKKEHNMKKDNVIILNSLADDECELIHNFRKLTINQKAKIIEALIMLESAQKEISFDRS